MFMTIVAKATKSNRTANKIASFECEGVRYLRTWKRQKTTQNVPNGRILSRRVSREGRTTFVRVKMDVFRTNLRNLLRCRAFGLRICASRMDISPKVMMCAFSGKQHS